MHSTTATMTFDTLHLNEFIDNNLVTKSDIRYLEKHFELRIKELELRMTLRLGGIMLGGISMIVTLMKLLKL